MLGLLVLVSFVNMKVFSFTHHIFVYMLTLKFQRWLNFN